MTKLFETREVVVGLVVGALAAPEEITTAIGEHFAGQWRETDAYQQFWNHRAIRRGGSVFTVHVSKKCRRRFWIVTAADRSITKVILPEDM